MERRAGPGRHPLGKLLEGIRWRPPHWTRSSPPRRSRPTAPILRAIARAAWGGETSCSEDLPGTGKSQTITNLLGDLRCPKGKKVLFVAEKQAALDVVRHRLGEIGLLPYALDLHDHNARPVEVRARIRTALAQRARPDLDGYRAALGEVEGLGLGPARVRGAAASGQPGRAVPVECASHRPGPRAPDRRRPCHRAC